MRSRKNRVSRMPASPDLEKGPVKVLEDEHPTTEEPEAGGEQIAGDDDSDNNDKFWKMFQEEAAAEASWKVDIWKTDLDSLLVFAGLFAAVVSAFLIDLRFHLRPDPVLTALNGIASILRNETEPPELEHARPVVRGVGFLWYGSLVVTLIGALWGVLAKGWLGELLREPPNNPADRAMERWRRDKAARKWHMEIVITAVPLLTQIGLAMFLSGFVVQSFDDNHGIGVLVLVYVTLGALAYAIFTILPIFRPDCPYRTPLTNFFDPVSAPKVSTLDENTQSKIQILVSRLNRSANDEIFTSAASVLDAKLESPDSEKWLKGVEKRASEIADAFSVRLKSFAHRVHSIRIAPSVLKDVTNNAGSTSGEALIAPIEQGITCLRVLLKSIEATTMTSEGEKSPWVKQDMDRNWRISNIYPPTWRLLSLSIHITKLVATKADYQGDNAAEIDWKNLISKTFSDLTVRSISGASACRGLLHGGPNLRRVCALGLAMFIETEATIETDTPKLLFFEQDEDPGVDAGKIITEQLWTELVGIWKASAVQLVCQARSEGEAKSSLNIVLDHELYQEDIKRAISGTMFKQLDNRNWTTRKQAIQILTKLSQHHAFQEAILTSGVLPKVVSKLSDSDDDVRAAAIRALSTFSEQYLDVFTEVMKTEKGIPKLVATLTDNDADVRAAAAEALVAFGTRGGPLKCADQSPPPRWISIAKIYQPDIKSAIPDIITLLDHDAWRIREQTIQLLCRLAELDAFQEPLKNEGIISKLVAKLTDSDSDVHAAAVAGVLAFGPRELYHDDTKSAIPTIVQQVENDTHWAIRESAIKLLMKFSEIDVFRDMIRAEGFVAKLVGRLEDDDADVREAATSALQTLSAQEPYQMDIKSSMPAVVEQLGHKSRTARLEAIRMFTTLSENAVFQDSIKTNNAVSRLVGGLTDNDDDVREATATALLTFGTQSYFKETVNSESAISSLFAKLVDNSSKVRNAAVRALSTLSVHEIYSKEIKTLVSIPTIVKQLQDESWTAREQAVEILVRFAPNADFQAVMQSEKTIPALVKLITDRDEDVRTAVAKALSVFGTLDSFQKTVRSEGVISRLTTKLSDPFANVRNAAQSTLVDMSAQVYYQNDMKSAIGIIVKQLDDKNWATRQQAIQILVKLCERPIFHETMKTEMVVAKLVAKLSTDRERDEDVRATAAKALSMFAAKGLFLDRMKSEKTVSKLIERLSDNDNGVQQSASEALVALGKRKSSAELADFLQQVVSSLITQEKKLRLSVYNVLKNVKVEYSEESFCKALDSVICKFLNQTQKDRTFICQSIAIMSEAIDEGLTGKDLQNPSNANKTSRDAIESLIVRSKLIYDRNLPDQYDTVLALSRLAKNSVFVGCMKQAISGLIDALNNSDQNIRSTATAAISALSTQDEFRTDLVPAIDKLIQQLNGWAEDEDYPLHLVEAMCNLVTYKEFQMKLKHVVFTLMSRLRNNQKDALNDITNQENDKNAVAFCKTSCRLISRLCKEQAVGKDLVPQLTRVLSEMDGSLNEALHDLVNSLVEHGRLTMNDRIALASSLRIIPKASDNSELQICKLNMAALLDEARKRDHPPSDYNFFLGAVLGSGNETVKSKLSTLVTRAMQDTKPELNSS